MRYTAPDYYSPAESVMDLAMRYYNTTTKSPKTVFMSPKSFSGLCLELGPRVIFNVSAPGEARLHMWSAGGNVAVEVDHTLKLGEMYALPHVGEPTRDVF